MNASTYRRAAPDILAAQMPRRVSQADGMVEASCFVCDVKFASQHEYTDHMFEVHSIQIVEDEEGERDGSSKIVPNCGPVGADKIEGDNINAVASSSISITHKGTSTKSPQYPVFDLTESNSESDEGWILDDSPEGPDTNSNMKRLSNEKHATFCGKAADLLGSSFPLREENEKRTSVDNPSCPLQQSREDRSHSPKTLEENCSTENRKSKPDGSERSPSDKSDDSTASRTCKRTFGDSNVLRTDLQIIDERFRKCMESGLRHWNVENGENRLDKETPSGSSNVPGKDVSANHVSECTPNSNVDSPQSQQLHVRATPLKKGLAKEGAPVTCQSGHQSSDGGGETKCKGKAETTLQPGKVAADNCSITQRCAVRTLPVGSQCVQSLTRPGGPLSVGSWVETMVESTMTSEHETVSSSQEVVSSTINLPRGDKKGNYCQDISVSGPFKLVGGKYSNSFALRKVAGVADNTDASGAKSRRGFACNNCSLDFGSHIELKEHNTDVHCIDGFVERFDQLNDITDENVKIAERFTSERLTLWDLRTGDSKWQAVGNIGDGRQECFASYVEVISTDVESTDIDLLHGTIACSNDNNSTGDQTNGKKDLSDKFQGRGRTPLLSLIDGVPADPDDEANDTSPPPSKRRRWNSADSGISLGPPSCSVNHTVPSRETSTPSSALSTGETSGRQEGDSNYGLVIADVKSLTVDVHADATDGQATTSYSETAEKLGCVDYVLKYFMRMSIDELTRDQLCNIARSLRISPSKLMERYFELRRQTPLRAGVANVLQCTLCGLHLFPDLPSAKSHLFSQRHIDRLICCYWYRISIGVGMRGKGELSQDETSSTYMSTHRPDNGILTVPGLTETNVPFAPPVAHPARPAIECFPQDHGDYARGCADGMLADASTSSGPQTMIAPASHSSHVVKPPGIIQYGISSVDFALAGDLPSGSVERPAQQSGNQVQVPSASQDVSAPLGPTTPYTHAMPLSRFLCQQQKQPETKRVAANDPMRCSAGSEQSLDHNEYVPPGPVSCHGRIQQLQMPPYLHNGSQQIAACTVRHPGMMPTPAQQLYGIPQWQSSQYLSPPSMQ